MQLFVHCTDNKVFALCRFSRRVSHKTIFPVYASNWRAYMSIKQESCLKTKTVCTIGFRLGGSYNENISWDCENSTNIGQEFENKRP